MTATPTRLEADTYVPPFLDSATIIEAWLDDDPTGLAVLRRLTGAQPPLLRIPWNGSTAVLVTDPALIDEVLVTRAHEFGRETAFHTAFAPLLGTGALTSTGPAHHDRRRDLLRAMAAVTAAVDPSARRRTRSMVSNVTAGSMTLGWQDLDHLHWHVLTEALAAKWPEAVRTLESPDSDVRRWLSRADDASARQHRGWADVRRQLTLPPSAEGGGPSTQLDDLLTLLFAGRDTSLSALIWTTACVATQMALQDRIARELTASDRSTTLEHAVTEALRLYPPTPALTRQPVRSTSLGGYHLDTDTVLLLSPFVTQRSAHVFADPLTYRPSRWAEPRELPRSGYFPFGAGPLSCVGRRMAVAEVTTVVGELIRRHRLEARTMPPERLLSTLVPAHDVRITLRPRESR